MKHFSRKFFFSFFWVTMQSICMKQCHLHLRCGYILIPKYHKKTLKTSLFELLGLVWRTKTSLHQIVNVCLQCLFSLYSFRPYDIRTGSIVRPLTLSYITRLSVDKMMVQRQLPRWKMDDRLFLETFLTGN